MILGFHSQFFVSNSRDNRLILDFNSIAIGIRMSSERGAKSVASLLVEVVIYVMKMLFLKVKIVLKMKKCSCKYRKRVSKPDSPVV